MRTGYQRRDGGTILILSMVIAMALGFLVTFFLSQNTVQARATRFHLSAVRALYEAYSELEKARTVIAAATYDAQGHNGALRAAIAREDKKIEGTEVEVAALTGTDGTWYGLTVRIPYEDAERVVTETVREIDFFSSYNLFVSEDPAGISGSPIGAIHSNRGIQFYFPDGLYRHSVTAVEGVSYKSGATTANTTISGPFNPSSARIELDYEGSDRFNLNYIEANAETGFRFDGTNWLKMKLYVQGGEQWVHLEEWSKPEVRTVTEDVIVGYRNVNPREETYTYTEAVKVGTQTKTRDVQVFDHDETVTENVSVPVYVDDTRMKSVAVYRTETRTRDVPVYRNETRTRTVTKKVWVVLTGGTGGTAVGGDSGQLGYWADQQVEETYTVQVLDHYDTESYSVQVLDHYDEVPESYKRLDHYDTVPQQKTVAVYRTETQTYEEDIIENQTRTGTRTVYDQEPITETRTRTDSISSAKLNSRDAKVPDNGLIYTGGEVKSLAGEVIDRVTVASRGSVLITGDLVYKDKDGNSAYRNGKTPWLPYEPNPDYKNRATLGIIARVDAIISRGVPDNLELNASVLAMTGRVGIEGIQLDANGEVSAYNKFVDQFGRSVTAEFRKNSIRRLGGITTAKRPVETVVKDGAIRSGFNVGQAVFDVGLLEGPPPFFIPFPIPRFFATVIDR